MDISLFKKLKDNVSKYLEDESFGHDFFHAERVFDTAVYLHKQESGDAEIIGCAALVHDLCRPWEKKTGKSHFSPEALEIIGNLLRKSKITEGKIKSILDVVAQHDIYDWTNKIINKSIELQIVQDADNLDAMGAIGIGRAFAYGAVNNKPVYIPGENLNFTEDFIDKPKPNTSVIAHFYEKLLKLKQNMNTKTGKELAEERHQFMEIFLKQFFKEWQKDK